MKLLEEFLQASAALHTRLCPRQALGVRMGLLAGRLLELNLPQVDKRLLTIAETDGCMVDGISATTHCSVGRRTLRVEDYGKVAATFVDTHTEQAIRITPRAEARALAWEYAPQARNRWGAQLTGYQRMPDELLLSWQWVSLAGSLHVILGRHGKRVICEVCREEIINQREVVIEGTALCRACAGRAYYLLPPERQAAAPACCDSLV
jgi:formylmethanofuran dehydrogenase subunit E